jgi:hypothetical protein
MGTGLERHLTARRTVVKLTVTSFFIIGKAP